MRLQSRKMAAAISAMCLASTMMLPAMSAFAVDPVSANGTITIQNANSHETVENKTFTVYKIFDLYKREDTTTDTSGGTVAKNTYKYLVTDQWLPFFINYYNTAKNLIAGNEGYLNPSETNATKIEDAKLDIAEWLMDIESESETIRALALALQKEVVNKTFISSGSSYTTVELNSTNASYSDDKSSYTLTLPQGYYLIVDDTQMDSASDKARSAPILISTDGTTGATVNLKADKPSIDKNIWMDNEEDEDTDNIGTIQDNELVDANTANIGDTVNYVIRAQIPDMDRYDKYDYIITDTLSSGLTYTTGSLSIKVKGVTVYDSNDTTTVASDITVTLPTTGSNIIKIDWVDLKDYIRKLDLANQSTTGYNSSDTLIEVQYQAVLNENAVTSNGDGNKNSVDLIYSNDPSNSGGGDTDSKGKTPSSDVYTYSTEIKVAKVDSKNKPLTGAEFTIKSSDSSTDKTMKLKETIYYKKDGSTVATADEYAQLTDEEKGDIIRIYVESGTGNTEVAVSESGYLIFKGLGEGRYTITETKAPDGYNSLSSSFDINISCTLPNVSEGNTTCTWTYQVVDENLPAGVSGVNATIDSNTNQGIFTLYIVNRKGTIFPMTGGTGLFIIYAVGILMLVGAFGVKQIKKRTDS